MSPNLASLSSYLISIIGKILLLLAFPLSFGIIIVYDYVLADFFQNLNINIELRGFLTVPLTFLLILSGRFLSTRTPNSNQRIYFATILCFAILSVLATLGVLAFVLIMLFFSFISAYPINPTDRYPFYTFVVTQFVLALGQLGVTSWLVRYHGRLLQSTRAKRAAGNQALP